MTSDLLSALEVLDDDALYKSTYTLLYFTVTRLNKLSQQPVEVWQCTNTACKRKDAIFAFQHFPW